MSIKLEVVGNSLEAYCDYCDLQLGTPSESLSGDIMELLFTTIGKACDVSAGELPKGRIYDAHDKMCFIYRVTFPHKYYNEITTFIKDNQESLQGSLDKILFGE